MADQTDRNQEPADGPGRSDPPPQEPYQSRQGGKPRRRRWLRITGFVVLCIIIGLVVLAAVLPTVVSSKYGTRYVVSALNSRLRGHVDVQTIHLSWGGPSTLTGLTLRDPQDRQVLSLNQVTVREGLWHIARSPMAFGQVDLDQIDAVVYLHQDQSPSLVQAVESRQPAATQPIQPQTRAGPPPAPKGQLVIHGGTVRVIKPDGQELGVTHLNGQLTLDTLDSIHGQLGAQLASGGQIQADVNIKNLVASGQIDANQAVGQFAVRTQEPVKVAPLASFADRSGVNGLVNLDFQGHLDHGAMQANLKTQLSDFYTRPKQGEAAPQAKSQPIYLALSGQVTRSTQQEINGSLDLTGGAGTANAKFAFAPSSQPAGSEQAAAPATQPAGVTGEDLMALLLTGKPLALPNVRASVQGSLNLQALAAAIPDLLQIQQGVEITRGELRISNLEVHTQPALTATGAIELADLTATRNGQPVTWQPIALNINAHVVPDQGLQVEQVRFQSGFAQASIQGNPASLQGRFDTDLARLDQQLRQLVNLGNLELGGTLAGRFTVARAGDNEVKVASNIQATNLHYVSGDQKLDVRQATLNPDASLLLQNQNPQRVVLHSLDANVDQQIQATAEGSYDFQDKAWKTDVNLQQAQLPYLVAKARNMGIQAFEQYAGYTGTIDLRLKAGSSSQTGAITSTGGGTVTGLEANGKPVSETITLRWQEAAYMPNSGQASLQTATVKADFANLTAENVSFQPGQNMVLNGKVSAGADVARTLAAAYLLAGDKQEPPALAGQLQLASNMQTKGQVVSLDGDATVDNFQVGAGEQTLRQEQVRLTYNTQIDNQNETIDLRQAKLVSAPLTASLAGTIQQFRSRKELDLRGDYQAKWDQVMTIVHEFAPATAKTVDLKGNSSSKFTVAGPAWQEDAKPPYRGVTAQGFDISWQSGQVYGLELGRAVLSPHLADGRLELPTAEIPASGGTISLGGTVDLTQPTPQLRIPGQLQLMQNIDLNSDIGRQLLSFVNPLFSQVTGLDGKVSMVVQDIDLPLGEAIKQTGSGRGQLNMENVRVKPAGAFGLLVQVAGAGAQGQGQQGRSGQGGALGSVGELGQIGQTGQQGLPGQSSPQQAVDIRIGNPTFVISNGRINYDNFVLTFANGVETVFSGWVGFDDTVKMFVGMPVTAGLMQMAGVKGPVAQYASVLQGARIDVPLVGSRTDPKLDFAEIKIQPLVEQAIKNLASQGIQQGIRTAVPGGQLLPLPGEKQGQGQQGGLLPKLPTPGLPGQQQQQQPPAQQQQQQQQQGQQPQQQQGQQQTPGEEIGNALKGVLGGDKK